MPAVALQIVASNCARSSISSVEGLSANDSKRKGRMSDGEAWAGMEEGGWGSLLREQTRRGT